jgi:hypothetical protein
MKKFVECYYRRERERERERERDGGYRWQIRSG